MGATSAEPPAANDTVASFAARRARLDGLGEDPPWSAWRGRGGDHAVCVRGDQLTAHTQQMSHTFSSNESQKHGE
jgi:hypothetical protein